MGRFDLNNSSKYKNPVDKGSFVYIYDVDIKYEAKTAYKVAFYDKETRRVLVEVDPKKNLIDGKYIKGWADEPYRDMHMPNIIKKDKLYWWVCLWQQVQNRYVLKNE